MRIPRIHTHQELAVGSVVELEEGPSRHICKVLRMTEGRPLVLFNGCGGEYQAQITQVSKKHVTVEVTDFLDADRASPLDIELAIGLSKGDRFELVLQKATELGVRKITPLFTERSEVKLAGERLEKKLNSWRQIIISACEQCQLNIVPELTEPKKLDLWLPEQKGKGRLGLVLHHRSDSTLSDLVKPEALTLLIGPEGGLSEDEITRAQQSEYVPLTLGPRVLRTETAPLAAISLAQFVWGDF